MADLPIHNWSSLPPPRVHSPRRSLAPVLGPLVVVAGLALLGATTLAIVVAAIAALTFTITRASSRARTGFERAATWVSRHVGRVLTFVLLGLVQLLVFTPIALLARLTRTDPLDPIAPHRPDSRWLSRGGSDRPLTNRQYMDEGYRRRAAGTAVVIGTPRWIRGAVGGLALLLLADVAIGSLLARLDRDETPQADISAFAFDPTAQEALRTQERAAELMRDLGQVGIGEVDPFMGWRFHDGITHASDLVNVVDGTRRTATSALDITASEVWFFGGSTMYGSGQADLATIPSVLVDLADAAGDPIRATNFGHPAYAQWQQVQLLEDLLAEGSRVTPDIVIFYDGFNDLTLQTLFGVHTEPTHLFADRADTPGPVSTTVAESVRGWWADHSATALAARRIGDAFDDGPGLQVAEVEAGPIDTIDPVAAADAAVGIHRRGVDHVTALGRAYDFEVAFFWQPFLYTRDPLTPAEAQLVDLPGYDTSVWLPLTDRARSRLAPPIVDLGDVFDEEPTSLFWDFVHTNERGAELVAEAIAPHLFDAIDAHRE